MANGRDQTIPYSLLLQGLLHLGDLVIGLFRHILEHIGVVTLFGGSFIIRLVRRLGVMDAFGADPLFQRKFPITVWTLREHGVPNLMATTVDQVPEVSEGGRED